MKIRIAIIFPTDARSENILSYCIVTITAQRFLLRADKAFTRSKDEFQNFGFEKVPDAKKHKSGYVICMSKSLHILIHVCMTEGNKNK